MHKGKSLHAAAVETGVVKPPKPKPPASEPAPADDLAKELADAAKEIDDARALIKRLETGDNAKQIVEMDKLCGQYRGVINERTATLAQVHKDLARCASLAKRVREALGVESNREILPAIEALKK